MEEEGENGAGSKGTSKFHVGRTPTSFTIESLPVNALPSTQEVLIPYLGCYMI